MGSELQVRKLDFCFDETVQIQPNPGNPAFGNITNFLSILGPCFEKYFIKAFRQAIPLVKDEQLRQQSEWFIAQEAQHSRHHLAHTNALVQKYPGLKATQDAVMESYMQLLETESMEFHLAYTAIVELGFGPTAKFTIEQRAPLMAQCDSQVASLVLWHFIEEFEHRNCAIDVYNAIVGSYWFRLKTIPAVVKHFIHLGEIIRAGLKKHVPAADNPFGHDNFSGLTTGIQKIEIASYLWHLLLSQMPLHKPDNLATPAWAAQWFRDESRGQDMTHYYPSHSQP